MNGQSTYGFTWTSDEDADIDDDDDAVQQSLDFELRFGKHKGAKLSTIVTISEGRDYMRYLLKWDELRSVTRKHLTRVLRFYDSEKARRKKKKTRKR